QLIESVCRRCDQLEYDGANAFGMSVFRHRQIGIQFVCLPGGSFRYGLSTAELEAARRLDATAFEEFIQRIRPAAPQSVNPFLITLSAINEAIYVSWDRTVRVDRASAPAHVPYDLALQFAQSLGARLATEVEWEYACRGNTQSLFFWGDSLPDDHTLARYLCPQTIDGREYEPLPNGFGLVCLFDGEWCYGRYADYSATTSHQPSGE